MRASTIKIVESRFMKHLPSISKLISSPKLCVIDISARRSLFKKIAGEKDTIVDLQPGVTIDLPSHLHARPVPNEPSSATAGWDEQNPGNGIHSVCQTLPPLRNQVCRDRHAVWKFGL